MCRLISASASTSYHTITQHIPTVQTPAHSNRATSITVGALVSSSPNISGSAPQEGFIITYQYIDLPLTVDDIVLHTHHEGIMDIKKGSWLSFKPQLIHQMVSTGLTMP